MEWTMAENKEYAVGYIIEDMSEYTQVAIYCNKMGDRHIEKQDNKYIVVKNTEPTAEELIKIKKMKLQGIEQQSLMPRYMRDTILDNPDNYNEVVVNKAREIEEFAEEIRSLEASVRNEDIEDNSEEVSNA